MFIQLGGLSIKVSALTMKYIYEFDYTLAIRK